MGKFGHVIREYRMKENLSLRRLSSELNISPSYLSDIEKGRRKPNNYCLIEKMARSFNLTEPDKLNLYPIIANELNEFPDDINVMLANFPSNKRPLLFSVIREYIINNSTLI